MVAAPEPVAFVESKPLRDREGVFRDREDAGDALARLLESYATSDALVLAIPAGGVPVGVAVAARLNLALDVAVVSKITLPWNSEAGYGAVAFDGRVRLNESLLRHLSLSRQEIVDGIARTRTKVRRRIESLGSGGALPSLGARTVILVDDGLASGFTMRVAVEAVRCAGASEIVVGVPTGHLEAVRSLTPQVDRVVCTNVRSGRSFAVASAYRAWRDVPEDEAAALLRRFADRRRAT